MIEVNCSNCKKSFSLSESLAGKSVRCRNCSHIFLVPDSAADVVEVLDGVEVVSARSPTPPPLGGRTAHEVDFEIFGNEMQYVEITLDPGETVIAEAGSMMYASSTIKMESVFGNPSQENQGFWQKIATAGKRVLTGESLFMTTFTNTGGKREVVAFSAPYPGKIIPLHLDKLGGEIICQKDAFLCGAKGIHVEIAFQKKIGVALFGGEGFIMQRLRGDGIACCHAGGTIMEKQLQPGESLRIDTGCIVALAPSVQYDIQFVGGFKNTIFGGEGLFFATLTGPGHIWLQSLPFSRLAGRVLANATSFSKSDEGSLLNISGVGKMFMGD
jgi:uncharacterized protein (TIGR00266 family)